MITPIQTMRISDIMERQDDLLLSSDDIKELARNERAKAISEFSEQIKARAHSTERNEWGKDTMISIWESLIDEIATGLKGE